MALFSHSCWTCHAPTSVLCGRYCRLFERKGEGPPALAREMPLVTSAESECPTDPTAPLPCAT
eukprot:6953930-Pyramimonas_sp.AAC.1